MTQERVFELDRIMSSELEEKARYVTKNAFTDRDELVGALRAIVWLARGALRDLGEKD